MSLIISALISGAHIIGIILIGICLFLELFLFKRQLSAAQVKVLTKVDLGYLFAALLVLTTGLLRWFFFEKTALYYTDNWVFLIKLSLFIFIGILSIPPTLHYFKLARMKVPQQSQESFQKIRGYIRYEIFILFFIPILAAFVARGFGIMN